MTMTILPGVNGSNPLGFLASIGLLRVLSQRHPHTRLGFLTDGTFHAFLTAAPDDIPGVVAEDASKTDGGRWMLEYDKVEKKGTIRVRDLKAPPDQFASYLQRCIDAWLGGDSEAAACAAAFATSVARDGKGNTKPTAFHFTAANMQFLKIAMEDVRAAVTSEWVQQSLFEGFAGRPGSNLRWDPSAERNWALMANNPNDSGTTVDAPLEWLAFRALPLFPTYPVRSFKGVRVVTTAVQGRGDEMRFTWPLWGRAVLLTAVRSLVNVDWTLDRYRAQRGVFALCTSDIRRTSQGFGNFGPAAVSV